MTGAFLAITELQVLVYNYDMFAWGECSLNHKGLCLNAGMVCVRRYAWYKLYNLSKTYNKNLTGGDVQTLAANVLLSAMAIPPFGAADLARSEAAAEQEKERSMRMANLLGFSVVRRFSITRPFANLPTSVWTSCCRSWGMIFVLSRLGSTAVGMPNSCSLRTAEPAQSASVMIGSAPRWAHTLSGSHSAGTVCVPFTGDRKILGE